jgi:hypothetical protein
MQSLDVLARRTNAEGVRPPPVVETLMDDRNGEEGLLNLAQTRLAQELRQMTLTRSSEPRFILHSVIKLLCSFPKEAEWPPTAVMIPNACGNDSVVDSHSGHLPQTRGWVVHEVNDQLRQCGIERAVTERDPFCVRLASVRPRIPRLDCTDERARGIDRGDARLAHPPDKLISQCSWATSNIQHPQPLEDSDEISEHRSEGCRIPTHELVVCFGLNFKAHDPRVYG